MSINELLIKAVTPIVSICEPVSYDGDQEEYCTFLIDDWPAGFADGMPFAPQCDLEFILAAQRESLEKEAAAVQGSCCSRIHISKHNRCKR